MNEPAWIVKNVCPKDNYTLVLTFASGETKIYNAYPLLKKKIYSQLRNLSFFLKAKVDCGTVIWDDDTDIAPEHLYEYSYPV